MRHDTDRPVGNALLVMRHTNPRHDAQIEGLNSLVVAEVGQLVEIGFRIQNTGFLDWDPEMGYRFKNVQGWPVLGPAYHQLPERVLAGGGVRSSWSFKAPFAPGIYEAEWQFVQRSSPIGSRFWFGVVVLPEGSTETGLRAWAETQIARVRGRPGFRSDWPALRRKLEREIWHEVKSELRDALSDEQGRLRGSVEATVRARWLPLLGYLAW
jgi:hypothetical protein